MNRPNIYEISIEFDNKKANSNLFQGAIPYLGSASYTDQIDISLNEIKIVANRTNIIDLNDIFYNHNSSLYNQIIKTIVFYYANNFSCPAISKVLITRKGQSNILDKKEIKNSEIIQPITNKITSNVSFNIHDIEIIFEESPKGKALLISLSYWLQAMSSSDTIFRFERLWRGFNRIYSFIGNTDSENRNHRALRAFNLNNPGVLNFSLPELQKYNNQKLRQSFRWRGLILNDYKTPQKTQAFHDFVLRYTDERVMKLIQETLPYRQQYLANINLLGSVNQHLNNELANPTKSDEELISLLCIKYMYYVRNKSFHGERLDGNFRLSENKETKEFKKLNNLLSKYMTDLINSNDKF